MFNLELLQAVSDWQRGTANSSRGENLKKAAQKLPSEFRECDLVCYRQISLKKGSLWQLADELFLPEKISAWTISRDVARKIKRGVPPKGEYQGVIFAISPPQGSVIINLERLYRNKKFYAALVNCSSQINQYSRGAKEYKNSQKEVVLELSSIRLQNIEEFGGYSSDLKTLACEYFGHTPTDCETEWFNNALITSGSKLGPSWIGGCARNRILKKIESKTLKLRTLNQLQSFSHGVNSTASHQSNTG